MLRNILAFGTDGEVELYKALATNFLNAVIFVNTGLTLAPSLKI